MCISCNLVNFSRVLCIVGMSGISSVSSLLGDVHYVKAIMTSLHSRSVLGRVIVESLTKELQLKRTFGCE